jgi:hypothetical protein
MALLASGTTPPSSTFWVEATPPDPAFWRDLLKVSGLLVIDDSLVIIVMVIYRARAGVYLLFLLGVAQEASIYSVEGTQPVCVLSADRPHQYGLYLSTF